MHPFLYTGTRQMALAARKLAVFRYFWSAQIRDITCLQRQWLQAYLKIITFERTKAAMNVVIHKFSCEYRLEMGGDGANSYTTGDRRKWLLLLTKVTIHVFCMLSLWSIHTAFYLLSFSVTLAHLLSQDSTLLTFFFFLTFQKRQIVHILEYLHVPDLFLYLLASVV